MTAISLEMVLPGLIGFWIGRALGSMILAMVLLVLGVILGMTVGIIHLAKLASSTNSPKREGPKSSKDKSESSPKT